MGIFDISTTALLAGDSRKGALKEKLQLTGRFPPVGLTIIPLDKSRLSRALNRFTEYNYQSSVLTPVDVFSFNMKAPDSVEPMSSFVKSGDIAVLTGNEITFGTGIIDEVDMECLVDQGESVRLSGRDLMSQLEDQDAISANDTPIYGNRYTIAQVLDIVLTNTRLKDRGYTLQDAPSGAFLFATEPGENKLSALQRYLEPLNCLMWMSGDGKLIVGRPNMAQKRKGVLFISKEQRRANCLSIKIIENVTRTPNIIVPIWSGQEFVTDRIGAENRVMNAFDEPTRLRKLGHIVIKTVVVSNPTATNPQGLSNVTALEVGQQNILQAYAKREVARQNAQTKVVQVEVPGHYNELGEPFAIDTVYKIQYDRYPIDEEMYLFEVEYMLTVDGGQRSVLRFCPLGTIVSDVRAP